jgi:dipeptidyl aminopeptidase/acylaminoacyl peptidase
MSLLSRLLLIAAFGPVVSMASTAALAAPLTMDQLMNIRHPSDPLWSRDGKHIAYLWDRCDIINLYLVDTQSKAGPQELTNFSDGKVSAVFWAHDGQALYFEHGGKLWKVAAAAGNAPEVVWDMPAGTRNLVPSPDGEHIAVALSAPNGDTELAVRTLATGAMQSVAKNPGLVYTLLWSPDAKHLAYVGNGKLIPHDSSPEYSGAKLVFRNNEFVSGKLFVVPAAGGTPVAVGAKESRYTRVSWVGPNHLTYEQESADFKTRNIMLISSDGGTAQTLHSDQEDKFWSLPEGEAGGEPTPSPDGKWIAYLSDTADGWDHLYVIPAAGGTPIQITSGQFESWRPAWSHDSRALAFDANLPEHLGDRRVGIATMGAGGSAPAVRYVTEGDGTNTEPYWAPDDSALVYQHTDWQNSADFYTVAVHGTGQPVRLTSSMPADLDKSLLVRPQHVVIPGADGTPEPGWLFVPKNLDRSKKHPAIVWIHGDGINQNYDGWHIQRNYAVYYSFHQYLLQQGYVVFAPDYRGSIGYGSKWRSAVSMDVGGKDAEDASRAGDYLKTLPYVDGDRMGVWGLSYGGFFTLIAATRHPLLFRSAVDVAGVVDYAMYYGDPYHGDWTASRMGTPDQNPSVYANASPISHIGELQHPLLILHGTSDVNVPFIESVRLIDEALRQKKGDLISFMMYPGEFHYFSREHVIRDAWERVDRFFATTLQNPQ